MANTTSISNQLETKSIGRLIWHYSIPSIIGTALTALYNIFVRVFVGQGVGTSGIAGLGIAYPFIILLIGLSALIGVGAATRISIALGEKNKGKSEKILGNTFTLAFIIYGFVIITSYLFLHDLLKLFGGTEKAILYAEEYLQIVIPGSILATLTSSLNNIIRSSGHPRKAMITLIITTGINLILTSIFISYFHWGIRGAAIATNIGYLIGSVWVFLHFIRKKSNLQLYKKNFRLEKDIVRSILSIGVSPFSMQVATCIVIILFNSQLEKYGGDLAIGAYSVVSSLLMLLIMIVVGLNLGTQPIIGYHFGAKSFKRMFLALKYQAVIATLITSIGFILGSFFPTFIVSFFSHDVAFQSMAAEALKISVAPFPILGLQIVFTNFFLSTGKARLSIILSITDKFILLIPSLLLLPIIWGLNGVWAATPVSDGLFAILNTLVFILFVRKFRENNMNSISQTINDSN